MATERTVKIKVEAEGQAIDDLLKEIDQLKDKIKTASDPKAVKKLNDEFEETTRKLKGVEKATKEMTLNKTFEEVHGNILPLSGRLGELEDRMYELALAGKADTQEFKDMNEKAAKYRTTIKDVDRQVDMLADNKGMSVFSAGADEVGSSLLRMDFETAAIQANSLAMASSKISFGSAIKSVKALGSTFASLGKALLTNPFFLIIGTVALIVAAIVGLMSELGILQKIFDAVGDAIGWVIQQFKDLLDWMGLTDYAGEDYAQKQIDRNKKLIKSFDQKTASVVAGMDHEIKMMEAQGKETEKLEREKLLMLREAAKSRMKLALETAQHLIKVHGADSEEVKEQVEAIRLLTAETKQAARDIQVFDAQQTAENKKKREESLQSDFDAKKEAADKWRDKQKQIAEAQLSADKMIEQANIELIENEMERNRQMAVFNEEQSFKEINRELLTNEQIEELTIQHQTRLALIQEEFDAGIEAAKNERTIAQNERLAELRMSERELELENKRAEYEEDLELAKGNNELKKEVEQQLQDDLQAIKDKHKEEDVSATKAAEDAKLASVKAASDKEASQRQAVIDGAINAVNSLLSAVVSGAEEGSKAQENAMVVQAVMQGAMGAVAAYAGMIASIPGPVGIALGAVAAASVVAATAINVSKIKSAKSAGSSASAGGGGASAPNVGTPQDMPQETPTMSDFNDNEDTNQNAGGSVKRQVMVVDYTDIKDKGNEVNGLQNRVKLA